MKKFLCAAAVFLVLSVPPVMAAEEWDMAYIGRMKLPAHVTFQEGEQQALPFVKTGGPRWTFIKKAMLDGHFYTMTYADGPDFSYGWAASLSLGSQYLQEKGDTDYRGKTPAEQMDRIAGYVNDDIARMGASYEGKAPLKKVGGRDNPRWEGSFTVTTKERDITYRETYHAVIQVSGFRVMMGILASDADQTALTEDLGNMLARRRFFKEKDLLYQMLGKKLAGK